MAARDRMDPTPGWDVVPSSRTSRIPSARERTLSAKHHLPSTSNIRLC